MRLNGVPGRGPRLKNSNPSGAIAVESERRLALPCGEIALEIEAMLRERRLSGAGYGFTVKLFEDWIRVDLDPQALGLPQA